ncbi:MAG: MFS transporter [Armatimonadota bacterium]
MANNSTNNLQDSEMLVPLNRGNYRLAIANGILVALGNRLLDPVTILPLLVYRLSGLAGAVGILQAIFYAAPALTQLFAARWIDTAPRKRPIFNGYSAVRFIALMGMAGALLGGSYLSSTVILILLLSFFTLWFLAQGITTLAFMDMIARSVPTTKRGSLWMWRQSLGRILVLVIAIPFVHYMLRDNPPAPFPINYGYVVLCAAVVLGVAWLIFSRAEEPAGKPAGHTLTLRQHLARGLRLLRRDAHYRRLIRVQMLLISGGAIAPFLITFGAREWDLPDSVAATFLTVSIISHILGAFIVGKLSDNLGNRRVIILAGASILATSILSLVVTGFTPAGAVAVGGMEVSYRLLVLCICFLGVGLSMAAVFPGYMNYMMDIAPRRKRPSYFGFASVSLVPSGLAPLAFGWVADVAGFSWIFLAASVLSATGLLLAVRMEEPREVLGKENVGECGG